MGRLYVVATPIGNLEDITLRAIKILLVTPVIACEDTRHTGQLIKLLSDRYSQYLTPNPSPNIGEGDRSRVRYISIRDFNEIQVVDKILMELQSNDVALVSDAGTPLISDPGFKLVRAAKMAGITVIPIPGPCAAIAALSASGLPTDKFMFWGFLPKKWELLPKVTHIIYESPLRIAKTLDMIKSKYPQAKIIIASELTKIHESIGEVLPTKGEAVILVNFSPSLEEE